MATVSSEPTSAPRKPASSASRESPEVKKRQAMVAECLVALHERLPGVVLRAKQLYHDREEVSVLAALV